MKPTEFKFESYEFKPREKRLLLNYLFLNKKNVTHRFTEEIIFPKTPNTKAIPSELLDETFKIVHLINGISYYKLFCPKKITANYTLTEKQSEFFQKIYLMGLGEFLYRNNLSPSSIGKFEFDKKKQNPKGLRISRKKRSLYGIGGGKDSIVVAELLKQHNNIIKPFVLSTQKISPLIKEVLKTIDEPSLTIKRFIDPQLFKSIPETYNGHVPISAIIAGLGVLSAIIYDYDNFIVGNEQSSNEGNLEWQGISINHQWSKSQEFETMFQKYIHEHITPDITFFSLLRPFNEIRIAKMFAQHKKYFGIFSSCNKNFKAHKKRIIERWCNDCPKCYFVFLILAPFVTEKELIKIFGKNLFKETKSIDEFKKILGINQTKPFECVGTFDEARFAMSLSQQKYKDTPVIKELIDLIKIDDGLEKKIFDFHDAPTLPDHYKLYGINNCAIIGYGKEGAVTHEYLKKFHPKVKVHILDQKNDKNYLDNQEKYEFAIKTPSLPKEKIKIPYTTATNIFFSEMNTKHTLIGVTGTKGKSTTSSLIFHILKTAGYNVRLIGNIGYSMLNVLLKKTKPDTIFIIELSSYQLSDLNYSPHISVVTNLYSEHLDHHGIKEKYYEAKSTITKYQTNSDYFIYNKTFVDLTKWAKNTQAQTIDFTKNKNTYKSKLIGKHNQLNMCAAVAVANIYKIKESIIKKALLSFSPLPHRLEYVGKFNGIIFYNDANASTPEATIMAIESLKNIDTIFLGGLDRGYDFTELEKTIEKYGIKNIVRFPDSGKRISISKNKPKILDTASMKEAIQFAYENTKPGKICLLSCASPSYSLWKNFEEKAAEFKKYILKLK